MATIKGKKLTTQESADAIYKNFTEKILPYIPESPYYGSVMLHDFDGLGTLDDTWVIQKLDNFEGTFTATKGNVTLFGRL